MDDEQLDDARPAGRTLPALAARAQLGDRRALDELLRALQAPLLAHLRSFTGDQQGAEDALQDTLFTVCRKLRSLRDPRWVRAWAYRIATRTAIRRSKRERWWRDALGDALGGAGLEAVEAAESEPRFEPELLAVLPGMVDGLSPGSRVVLRMHYLEGLTYVEIAEALEISVGTVKSRLSYGLAALRARLPGRRGVA